MRPVRIAGPQVPRPAQERRERMHPQPAPGQLASQEVHTAPGRIDQDDIQPSGTPSPAELHNALPVSAATCTSRNSRLTGAPSCVIPLRTRHCAVPTEHRRENGTGGDTKEGWPQADTPACGSLHVPACDVRLIPQLHLILRSWACHAYGAAGGQMPQRSRSSTRCRALRMARAMTVSMGLMPVGPGNRLASATKSPGTPWYSPKPPTTPRAGVFAHPRGAHEVDRVQLNRPPGHRTGQQPPQLAGAGDPRGAVEGQQHAAGARREQRLGGQFHAADRAGGVTIGPAGSTPAAPGQARSWPPGPAVLDQRSRGDDAVVVGHQRAELAAVGRQDPGQHRGGQVHRAQQESFCRELADLEGLVNAMPAGDILVEERGHHGVRVQRQVAAQLPGGRPQAGPHQQGRGLDRAPRPRSPPWPAR